MLYRPKRNLTLGSFKPGPRNAWARAACIEFILAARTQCPGILVVAGRQHTGKTHLLHAATHLAKTTEHLRSASILSHRVFAEEVDRATRLYGDLPAVIERFAAQDFFAIDDADELVCRDETSAALLRLLELRTERSKRTLLSATLDCAPSAATPLSDFIDQQWAVRLS